ncbi:hypothetical protein DIPPA_00893 [Diplonema papillatum]|nr:hypothetical protein DIPPA_00893 [Diplonema papillatum]
MYAQADAPRPTLGGAYGTYTQGPHQLSLVGSAGEYVSPEGQAAGKGKVPAAVGTVAAFQQPPEDGQRAMLAWSAESHAQMLVEGERPAVAGFDSRYSSFPDGHDPRPVLAASGESHSQQLAEGSRPTLVGSEGHYYAAEQRQSQRPPLSSGRYSQGMGSDGGSVHPAVVGLQESLYHRAEGQQPPLVPGWESQAGARPTLVGTHAAYYQAAGESQDPVLVGSEGHYHAAARHSQRPPVSPGRQSHSGDRPALAGAHAAYHQPAARPLHPALKGSQGGGYFARLSEAEDASVLIALEGTYSQEPQQSLGVPHAFQSTQSHLSESYAPRPTLLASTGSYRASFVDTERKGRRRRPSFASSTHSSFVGEPGQGQILPLIGTAGSSYFAALEAAELNQTADRPSLLGMTLASKAAYLEATTTQLPSVSRLNSTRASQAAYLEATMPSVSRLNSTRASQAAYPAGGSEGQDVYRYDSSPFNYSRKAADDELPGVADVAVDAFVCELFDENLWLRSAAWDGADVGVGDGTVGQLHTEHATVQGLQRENGKLREANEKLKETLLEAEAFSSAAPFSCSFFDALAELTEKNDALTRRNENLHSELDAAVLHNNRLLTHLRDASRAYFENDTITLVAILRGYSAGWTIPSSSDQQETTVTIFSESSATRVVPSDQQKLRAALLQTRSDLDAAVRLSVPGRDQQGLQAALLRARSELDAALRLAAGLEREVRRLRDDNAVLEEVLAKLKNPVLTAADEELVAHLRKQSSEELVMEIMRLRALLVCLPSPTPLHNDPPPLVSFCCHGSCPGWDELRTAA